MRGKTRNVGSYHAQRGWFYSKVQKVVTEWERNAKLAPEIIVQAFDDIWRVMENGCGELRIEVQGVEHRRFLCALMGALDELHDPRQEAGWVIRLYGYSKTPPSVSACEIKAPRTLAQSLLLASDPVSVYLRSQFSSGTLSAFEGALRSRSSDNELKHRILGRLANGLNEIIRQDSIYDGQRFAHVRLRSITLRLINQLHTEGTPRIYNTRLNRLLLEDKYPSELARMGPELVPKPGRLPRPFTYPEMAQEIIARGGPPFTAAALETAARRLLLTGKYAADEDSFHMSIRPIRY